jgi:hypothetical protein
MVYRVIFIGHSANKLFAEYQIKILGKKYSAKKLFAEC